MNCTNQQKIFKANMDNLIVLCKYEFIRDDLSDDTDHNCQKVSAVWQLDLTVIFFISSIQTRIKQSL